MNERTSRRGDSGPLSSDRDYWTGDPEMDRAILVGRAMAALPPTRSARCRGCSRCGPSVAEEFSGLVFALFIVAAVVGVIDLVIYLRGGW